MNITPSHNLWRVSFHDSHKEQFHELGLIPETGLKHFHTTNHFYVKDAYPLLPHAKVWTVPSPESVDFKRVKERIACLKLDQVLTPELFTNLSPFLPKIRVLRCNVTPETVPLIVEWVKTHETSPVSRFDIKNRSREDTNSLSRAYNEVKRGKFLSMLGEPKYPPPPPHFSTKEWKGFLELEEEFKDLPQLEEMDPWADL